MVFPESQAYRNRAKSFEGSVAFVFFSVVASLVGLDFYASLGFHFLYPFLCSHCNANQPGFFELVLSDYYYPIVVVSVLGAFVESLPLPDDNLVVYLAAFLPLYTGLV